MQAIFGSTVWAAGATCRTRVVPRPEGFGPPPPKLDLEDVLFEVSTIPKFCRLISSSDGCFSSKKTTSGAWVTYPRLSPLCMLLLALIRCTTALGVGCFKLWKGKFKWAWKLQNFLSKNPLKWNFTVFKKPIFLFSFFFFVFFIFFLMLLSVDSSTAQIPHSFIGRTSGGHRKNYIDQRRKKKWEESFKKIWKQNRARWRIVPKSGPDNRLS